MTQKKKQSLKNRTYEKTYSDKNINGKRWLGGK